MAEKKTGFNLAEALAGVSKLDTGANGREQIEYIDIDLIDDDPNNFYELSGLNELAANIELCGLQQPIRVRANPDDTSRVIIVSGHRRRAAIRQLVNDGRDDLRDIPCIRERIEGSAAFHELCLICANSDTRKLTSAEKSKQAERVEALLYQLKEEGYEFPGRMRDHVAEACKLSKTKLANLKVIRERLDPKTWKKAWEKGDVVDSVALAIAKLPPQHQLRCWQAAKKKSKLSWYYESDAKRDGDALKAIEKLKCPDGGTCQHLDQKFECHRNHPWNGCSGRCCSKCSDLGSCEYACPKFYEKIKQIKAEKREERKQQRLAQEEKDRPEVEQITALWARFADARLSAGLSIEEYAKAANIYTDERTKKNWPEREVGRKITRDTGMPYSGGNGFSLLDIRRLCKAAEILGVSIDYLLCRTDNPKGIEAAPAKAEQDPCLLCKSAHPGCDKCCSTCDDHCNAWQICRREGDAVSPTGVPIQPGPAWYPNSVEPNVGQEIIAVDATGYAEDTRYLRSGEISDGGMRWDEVTLWTPFPTGVTATPATEPPAAGWVPLQFVSGMEEPPKDGKYYCRFDCDGSIIKQLAWWDGIRGTWAFKDGGAKIDAKCLGWFPLPEDDDV